MKIFSPYYTGGYYMKDLESNIVTSKYIYEELATYLETSDSTDIFTKKYYDTLYDTTYVTVFTTTYTTNWR